MDSRAEEDTISYVIETGSQASFNALARDIYQAWSDILTPGTELHREAEAAKIDLSAYAGGDQRGIAVSKSAAGLDHSVVELVIAFLGSEAARAIGAGTKVVARDIWKTILLPLLQRKYGAKVLTENPKSRSKKNTAADSE